VQSFCFFLPGVAECLSIGFDIKSKTLIICGCQVSPDQSLQEVSALKRGNLTLAFRRKDACLGCSWI